MRTRRLIVMAVGIGLLASAGWATSNFNCNQGGRVFRLSPGNSPVDMTLMWNKSGADNDILVFTDTGDLVAIGIGIVDRFERVVMGTFPGPSYDVIVFKVSGPNSKCYFNVGQDLQTVALRSSERLVDRGRLADLARTDARYARIRQAVKKHLRAKAAAE